MKHISKNFGRHGSPDKYSKMFTIFEYPEDQTHPNFPKIQLDIKEAKLGDYVLTVDDWVVPVIASSGRYLRLATLTRDFFVRQQLVSGLVDLYYDAPDGYYIEAYKKINENSNLFPYQMSFIFLLAKTGNLYEAMSGSGMTINKNFSITLRYVKELLKRKSFQEYFLQQVKVQMMVLGIEPDDFVIKRKDKLLQNLSKISDELTDDFIKKVQSGDLTDEDVVRIKAMCQTLSDQLGDAARWSGIEGATEPGTPEFNYTKENLRLTGNNKNNKNGDPEAAKLLPSSDVSFGQISQETK